MDVDGKVCFVVGLQPKAPVNPCQPPEFKNLRVQGHLVWRSHGQSFSLSHWQHRRLVSIERQGGVALPRPDV